MAIEIEKKFLLTYLPSEALAHPTFICQGYMVNKKDQVVRIRLSGDNAFLTIKGATCNASRKEYEYPIPKQDAEEMLLLFCKKPLIEKIRYKIQYKGFEWVIDQFSGNNLGLIVAEIELDRVDQAFEKPDWIGKDVSDDPRYFNSNLIETPYSTWKTNDLKHG
ncbi:MAG: CYTH domain-containing protein [Proteobacteria bacterium]|nr:CYTH domain-containing protein [Pseudomonadota bacterium]MBU1583679.1 CYTH domain-containing protein [Pseudomonadota bacterium]MBU2630669.1 CYTH domain-containing protein [Pseudomonadota bacterium]